MKKIILGFVFIAMAITARSQNVIHGEYFIDSDPEFGNATPFVISLQDSDITQALTIPYSAFPNPGYHYIYMRTLDANGNWSITARRRVEVDENINSLSIIRVEYFFDVDNGFGADSVLQITASTDSTWNFDIPFNQLPATWTPYDTLFLRVQDSIKGNWSITTMIDSLHFTMVGITENAPSDFMFYPNPATDFVNIEFKENLSEPVTISVLNLMGEILDEQAYYERSIRIKLNQPGGIYFIRIKNSKEMITKKMVVQ